MPSGTSLPLISFSFKERNLHHLATDFNGLYVRDRASGPFYEMLGQTHVNGWSRVVVSQNGGSTSYIFPLRLGVLQWSRHLFNYLEKQENHN